MVSILLAVYNGEKSLPETLKSIMQQTYIDWEVIAIDDGSTDSSFSILTDFQKHFSEKIRIYQNVKNLGLTRSLIKAASHAHGKYIARIDAGDTFFKEKLEKQICFLETHPDHGIVGCNYTNHILSTGMEKRKNMSSTDEEIRSSILKGNPFAHSCIVMKTDVYKQSGGYSPAAEYAQDYELWFRILSITKGANLPEYLCRRTIDPLTSIGRRKQKQQMRQRLKTQWKYMSKKNITHYMYMVEPLCLLILPEAIKKHLRDV